MVWQYWEGYSVAEFSELVGKTITKFEVDNSDDEIHISTEQGDEFVMFHDQDCCECVTVEDICGDIEDIIGSPVLVAEEVTHQDENPEGVEVPEYQDSFTWTFYKIDTAKGGITIRWYGSSNGYYSERVDFKKKEAQAA